MLDRAWYAEAAMLLLVTQFLQSTSSVALLVFLAVVVILFELHLAQIAFPVQYKVYAWLHPLITV